MSLEDTMTADQQAVAAALAKQAADAVSDQANVDAATAKVAADQVAITLRDQHLSFLDSVSGALDKAEANLAADEQAVLDPLKAEILGILAQWRTVITG